MVYATKNIIPEKTFEGIVIPQHDSAHVWCRVECCGVEKDVCPGNDKNIPGKVAFNPVSEVRNWNKWIAFFAYWCSAIVNARRWREIERLKQNANI